MLIILTNLLCWIPAVFGYGILSAFLRNRVIDSHRWDFDMIIEPIFGMFCLSLLVSVLHFFVPIGPLISLPILFAGWILCWLRFRKTETRTVTFRTLALLAVWLLFVSFWAAQPPRNFDSGLYHTQAIQWLNKSALPFGLANLHDRFGLNSSWFSLAALIQLPGNAAEGVNSLSISALMIYFFGIVVFQAWKSLKTGSAATIFFSLAALLFLSDVTRRNISSPSPDLPVQILCVLLVGLALQTNETRSQWTTRCIQMLAFALFGATIKSSSLPFFFIPLSMLFFARQQKIRIASKSLLSRTLILFGVALSIWLGRGLVLSGCLNFPVSQTCFFDFPWAVPRYVAEHQWIAYKASAELTYPEQVPMSEWVGPWFATTLLSVDFLIPCSLLLLGFSIYMYGRKNSLVKLLWLAVPLFLALVLWFTTAPAIRFASGYFWSLGLLVFSVGLSAIQSGRHRNIAMLGVVLSAFLVFGLFIKFTFVGFPPINKALRDPHTFFFRLPIPQHRTETRTTLDGVPIHIPTDEDGACWLSELPCTPYFNEHLRTIRSAEGKIKMFSFPK